MNISTAIIHGIDLASGQSHCCDAAVTPGGYCLHCEEPCEVIHEHPLGNATFHCHECRWDLTFEQVGVTWGDSDYNDPYCPACKGEVTVIPQKETA